MALVSGFPFLIRQIMKGLMTIIFAVPYRHFYNVTGMYERMTSMLIRPEKASISGEK